MSHYVLNDSESPKLVEGALDALVAGSGGKLRRLDGYEQGVKVVVRSDFETTKNNTVSVISGGGSGHEPAYSGMVGTGLLTAAVCGDVFASPTANAVYQTICTVTGAAGCLVIVMNYMGDRLHFGMAVERAKQQGLNVQMVIVGDDCGLDLPPSKRRGIAGSVLTVKVACARAASGASLDEVFTSASRAAESVMTMGVALSNCNLPNASAKSRIPPGQMELSLGIHGEPGKEILPLETSSELATRLVTRISNNCNWEGAAVAILLVNNLGTLTPLEMTQVTADALSAARSLGITIIRHGTGPYITSLDMKGFSLSLLPVVSDDDFVELLDQPAHSSGWLPFKETGAFWDTSPIKLPPAREVTSPTDGATQGEGGADSTATRAMIERCCRAVMASEVTITELDEKVGDGDCGTTLKNGAERILKDISSYPLTDSYRTAVLLSTSLEESMGGTSGGLYAVAADAAACSLRTDPVNYTDAFVAAVRAIESYGGASIGSCTMMDALIPARDVLKGGGTLEAAAKAARKGADSTASLMATHGRSSYVPEDRVIGVVDPGALACAIWLEAAACLP